MSTEYVQVDSDHPTGVVSVHMRDGEPGYQIESGAAWDFIAWMTSKSYIKMVGSMLGWSHVPPGSRLSSYQIPQYKKVSALYGPLTLQSINATNTAHPTVLPVPYTGVQFLDIPEFQDLGTNVSEQFSAAIAGQKSVTSALAQAQQYAQVVGDTYRTG